MSLAIAGNSRGITSSLPSGSFSLPKDQTTEIRKIFKHLVKTLNTQTDGLLAIGQPRLEISTEPIINAFAMASIHTIQINLALAELLADSPSELAWIIAHELGHLYQASNGQLFDPTNAELDADAFAVLATLLALYDPYAGAGTLGKLAMLTQQTGLLAQFFDNLLTPHTSFSNRIGEIFDVITSVCGIVPASCEGLRDIFHPHLPGPLRETDSAKR